jgi:hypothetical protein
MRAFATETSRETISPPAAVATKTAADVLGGERRARTPVGAVLTTA